MTVGAVLIVLGYFWKVWATYEVGLDTYYCRDMFIGRSYKPVDEGFVASGPYRVSGNPMYSIGNLQAYGGALWYASWPGFVVAAVFQASIYVFHFLFELPFVRRVYGSAK